MRLIQISPRHLLPLATRNSSFSTRAVMSSYLSRLSPVPAFPEYTGPFKVGTTDVEIPVSELSCPSPAPTEAVDIPTIQFRIFYPTSDDSTQDRIPWLPHPQRQHVLGYSKFLGIGDKVANFLSFLPRHLNYTTIPAHKNAALRAAETENKRWPTMIFSHGLGGSRNSYSYIAGSLASHGVVVVCPEHRDGSAVAAFIRDPEGSSSSMVGKHIPYRRMPHEVNPEIYKAREAQLRIRLWEMGLIHEAILEMDSGAELKNLNTSTPSLAQFVNKLHVHEPGSIIMAGHSFGATTMHQLLKSTYYMDHVKMSEMQMPLFTPSKDSAIRKQITSRTVTMLLDMWCLPILAPNSEPLTKLPLPQYNHDSDSDEAAAAGGKALLAVESETFFKWTEHLHFKARLLSPDPSAELVSPDFYKRSKGNKKGEIQIIPPNFYYAAKSAHLSQSDFGVLFPWLTNKIFKSEEPERVLRLNLRAQLQLLRENGVPVARTCAGDLVEGWDDDGDAERGGSGLETGGLYDDKAILRRGDETGVESWKWIDTVGLGDGYKEKGEPVGKQVEESEESMKGELDPSEDNEGSLPRI